MTSYGYNYNPTETKINIKDDQRNETRECLICLDTENKDLDLKHFSEFNNDCKCNYYVHKKCLVSWIKKKKPDIAACLLCCNPIENSNEIAGIDTRITTEYHSRRARVMRLNMNDVLRNNIPQEIINITQENDRQQPILVPQEQEDTQITGTEREIRSHLVEIRNSRHRINIVRKIAVYILTILAVSFLAGILFSLYFD